MNIATNLHGRLRNTFLPLSHGLLPLFEAVINSTHGIEEAAISVESGWIRNSDLARTSRTVRYPGRQASGRTLTT